MNIFYLNKTWKCIFSLSILNITVNIRIHKNSMSHECKLQNIILQNNIFAYFSYLFKLKCSTFQKFYISTVFIEVTQKVYNSTSKGALICNYYSRITFGLPFFFPIKLNNIKLFAKNIYLIHIFLSLSPFVNPL